MSVDAIKTVAVIGAGTMGNGIAHVFARAGFSVILKDVDQRFLDRGMETISKNLDREVKKGKLAEADKSGVLGACRPRPMRRRFRAPILLWKQCRSDST